jgi:hypothetical protein
MVREVAVRMRHGDHQARFRREQRAHAVPVARLAGRARDHVVQRGDDAVDGLHVGGIGLDGGCRGRVHLLGRSAERGKGDGGGKAERDQSLHGVSCCYLMN